MIFKIKKEKKYKQKKVNGVSHKTFDIAELPEIFVYSLTVLFYLNAYLLQGLPPEQLKDVSCYTCYQKMKVAADSVRFTELQPSFLTQGECSLRH